MLSSRGGWLLEQATKGNCGRCISPCCCLFSASMEYVFQSFLAERSSQTGENCCCVVKNGYSVVETKDLPFCLSLQYPVSQCPVADG